MKTSQNKSLFNLFASDNFVVYNRNIANIIGLNQAVLLSELLNKYQFFEKQKALTTFKDKEGEWFYVTSETIRGRTSLSFQEQKTALKILIKAKLVECVIKELPAKRFFQLNEDRIKILLENQNNFTIYAKSANWIAEIDKLSPSATPISKEKEEEKDIREKIFSSFSSDNTEYLCGILYQKILEHSPHTKKPIWEQWDFQMRLLLEKDGGTYQNVKDCILFATEDDFWKKVILDVKGLSRNFGMILTQFTARQEVSELGIRKKMKLISDSISHVAECEFLRGYLVVNHKKSIHSNSYEYTKNGLQDLKNLASRILNMD